MERMQCNLGELKFAGAPGTFSGYGAVFGNVDAHDDVIAPGAFSLSLASLKAEGRSVPMYMEHGPMGGGSALPAGVWETIEEDQKGLVVAGRIIGLETDIGRYNHALVKEGAVPGLSIGFRVKKADYSKDPGKPRRTIKEIDLIEVSLVSRPANALARVTNVKSIESMSSMREVEDYLREYGLSKTQSVALISRIKGIGAGDPRGADGGPGDQVAELLAAIRRNTSTIKGI
jgi:HK97 family phage prohead protease